MKKDFFASPWKKVADNWAKYYTPPGRPSPEDCKRYADYIRRATNGKPARALVLGATPEIRNALHKFPIEVTVLDINLEMILAMNRSVKDGDQDIVVRNDWTGDLLADNYYDIVLGDLTWGNVPRELWGKYNKNLSRMLKKDGFLIHRVTMIPDGWKIQPIGETLKYFGKLPYTSQRHMELFFHLLTDSFNPTAKTISWDDVKNDLLPFWRNGKMVKGKNIPGVALLLKRLFAFWGDVSKFWQTDYPQILRNEIEPYFSIVEESISKDYLYGETSPFWFCQVKK